MLFDVRLPGAVLVLLCLLPAVVRLGSWRMLRPLLDDALLPERLLAHGRRNVAVFWTVIVCTIVLGRFQDLFWSLPLILVTHTAAGYPLRRALFDERWSLLSYQTMMFRLFVAADSGCC
jgi:hypothetical protein